jgi:hypothetical protein
MFLAAAGAILLIAGCGGSSAADTGCGDWLDAGGSSLGIDRSGVVDEAYFEKFDRDRIDIEFLGEQNQAVAAGCEADRESTVGDHLIPPG